MAQRPAGTIQKSAKIDDRLRLEEDMIEHNG